jgi:site-specific DNA recombinase
MYVRQSEDKTGNAAAVTRQERECRQLAERNGWTIGRVYTDNDRSATRGVRPAWRELLADVRAGRVTVVVAWHTDRLYRRVRDTLDLIEAGTAHGLRIETVTGGSLDLSTAAGRMIGVQLVAVAGYEGEQKSARQKAANLQRAQDGRIGWTRRPYGYDRGADGRVVVVAGEARELRKAAKRVLAGETVAAVVRDLNARHVLTAVQLHGCDVSDDECRKQSARNCPKMRRGDHWTQTALTRLLLSPRHAGRAMSNGADHGDGQWSAIFDAETAGRLRAKLTDPRRRTAPVSLAAKYLLSGLLTCGRCGGKLYASPTGTEGRRWMVYRCRAQHLARRLDLVDQVVDALIVARMSRPDAARLLSPTVDVAALRADADRIRSERGRLAAMVGEQLLSADDIAAPSAKLSATLADVERKIEQASGSSPLAPLVAARDVAKAWQAMPLRARRDTVRVLFESLTVAPVVKGARFSPDQVVPVWRGDVAL